MSKAESLNSSDMSDDYNALKADIASLKDDLSSLLAHTSESAKSEAGKKVDQGKEAFSTAQDKSKQAYSVAEDKVREYPLTSVGIAFGLGCVLATLRR